VTIDPTPRPRLWRDPTNSAEQAMTTYDEWVYRREQEN
jgi:hypothetical protein